MEKYFILEKKYHKCAIPTLEVFYNKDEAEAALLKAKENPNLVWASVRAVWTSNEAAQEKDKQIAELQEKLSQRNQIIEKKSNETCKLIELRNELQAQLQETQKAGIKYSQLFEEYKDKLHRRNLQIKDLKAKKNNILSMETINAIADLISVEGKISKRGDGRVQTQELTDQKRALKTLGAFAYNEDFISIYRAMDLYSRKEYDRFFSKSIKVV